MRTPPGNVPDELIPEPRDLVPHTSTPDTIAGWKALADGLLSDPCCAFHRNVEISSCYAWLHQRQRSSKRVILGHAWTRRARGLPRVSEYR